MPAFSSSTHSEYVKDSRSCRILIPTLLVSSYPLTPSRTSGASAIVKPDWSLPPSKNKKEKNKPLIVQISSLSCNPHAASFKCESQARILLATHRMKGNSLSRLYSEVAHDLGHKISLQGCSCVRAYKKALCWYHRCKWYCTESNWRSLLHILFLHLRSLQFSILPVLGHRVYVCVMWR